VQYLQGSKVRVSSFGFDGDHKRREHYSSGVRGIRLLLNAKFPDEDLDSLDLRTTICTGVNAGQSLV